MRELALPALFIGGSNADKLANAAATLGVLSETITEGGWILTTSSVSIILPQVEPYCATLPPDAPVVIYCLDNSSFCFCLRYANGSCCTAAGHCIHLRIPDFDHRLLDDLRRLHSFFKHRLSSFANCSVIPAGDLIAGKMDASNSDIIAAYSGWGAVHGSGTSYTRMALCLLDNLFRVPSAKPPPPPSNKGKRPRSESTSSSVNSSYSGTGSNNRSARRAFPDSSGAAPVAAPEAALAAASMAAPSGASTTLGAVGTPVTPATEPLQDVTHLMSPIFCFLYKKNGILCSINP